jgi:putative transposase
MPEHFHLLVSEPQERPLSTAMQALKLGFSRRVLAEQQRRVPQVSRFSRPGSSFEHSPQHIWQPRYYDFNGCTPQKQVEKLRYMHRNPVKRGLVESPELWPWSSFRSYAYQEEGVVRVNEWSVLKMKRRETTSFPS